MFKQITKKNTNKLFTLIGIATASLAFTHNASATVVEIKTSLSAASIKVNLFDQTTPETVKNFLNYVSDGHYNNTVVHRVSPLFVVQAGGYEFTGSWPLTPLVPKDPVVNEAVYSNVKGTIAMAKKGGDINSATNQWFFNLKDNSENLDRQNGGFTVFGQVIEGMNIIEKIAQLKLCTSGNLENIPMVIEANKTCTDMIAPGMDNFVAIEHVTVIDSSEVTDSNLTPLLSKFPDSDGDGIKDIDDAFPSDPSETTDTDGDGVGDNADAFPNDASETTDTDGDGTGDNADTFPNDPTQGFLESKDSGGSITWFALVMLALASTRKRFLKTSH